MAYNFIDKKYTGGTINTEIISNEQLAEELHKPIIKKCEKQKVYSSIRANVWVLIQQICN